MIGAGFDFFADNHDYVRLMRREALDGGAHLGIDLAAVLRPMWDRASTSSECRWKVASSASTTRSSCC